MKLTLKHCIYPIFLLGCMILSLNSCEYESDDNNYHEIAPPEENINVQVNLAGAKPEDVIYIYRNTYLYYEINTSSGSITEQKFYLDDSQIGIHENKYIAIDPREYDNKIHDLELTLKMTSGTGSLAEILGEEKSEAKIKYKLKYVKSDNNLEIKQRVNTDGNLELYWDKPEVGDLTVKSYQIYYYNEFEEILKEEITDPNQTSFIDKNYVYGTRSYRLVTTFSSAAVSPWENFYTTEFTPITNELFTYTTLNNDDFKIKWSNPNNISSKYVLIWDDKVYTSEINKAEITVKRPEFPIRTSKHYKLYILPIEADFNDYLKYPEVINYFKESYIGTYYSETSGRYVYAADRKNNKILVLRASLKRENMLVYDKDNLTLFSEYEYQLPEKDEDYHVESFKTCPNTGRVAIHYRHWKSTKSPKICVYSDYTLKTLLCTVSTQDWNYYFLTDDDKLIVRNIYETTHYNIYNAKTGKLIRKVSENNNPSIPAFSANSKYFFNYLRIDEWSTKKWYKLYEYNSDNSITELKYQANSGVTNIIFNPTNDNHVIMVNENKTFSIYEVPSLNIIKTIEGNFITIDPFTGNIMYEDKNFSSNNKMRILDKNYEEDIFNFTTSDYYYNSYTYFINNYISIYDLYFNFKN